MGEFSKETSTKTHASSAHQAPAVASVVHRTHVPPLSLTGSITSPNAGASGTPESDARSNEISRGVKWAAAGIAPLVPITAGLVGLSEVSASQHELFIVGSLGWALICGIKAYRALDPGPTLASLNSEPTFSTIPPNLAFSPRIHDLTEGLWDKKHLPMAYSLLFFEQGLREQCFLPHELLLGVTIDSSPRDILRAGQKLLQIPDPAVPPYQHQEPVLFKYAQDLREAMSSTLLPPLVLLAEFDRKDLGFGSYRNFIKYTHEFLIPAPPDVGE